MDELKAWCSLQLRNWEQQIEQLEQGTLRIEQQDGGGSWQDISALAVAQAKDNMARLHALLGRIEAGVEGDDILPADGFAPATVAV